MNPELTKQAKLLSSTGNMSYDIALRIVLQVEANTLQNALLKQAVHANTLLEQQVKQVTLQNALLSKALVLDAGKNVIPAPEKIAMLLEDIRNVLSDINTEISDS